MAIDERMIDTVHILSHLKGYRNHMFCGNVDGWWVAELDLDKGFKSLDRVTCPTCKDNYAFAKLGELP